MIEVKPRPNLIFLTTDQQRWNAWGLMNPEVKTPVLDRVFSRGLRWRHAVCQAPMCIPSRYSYMTGLYPSQVGCRVNAQTYQDPARMPVKVLAEYLSDGGYHTMGCGKTHYTMGADVNCGIPAGVPHNRGFNRRAAAGGKGYPEVGANSRLWEDEDPQARALFNKIEQEGSLPFPAGGEGLAGYRGSDWPLGLDRTREGWATSCALDFLDEAERLGKPWFLNLSYDLPHAPFCTVRKYEQWYDEQPVTVPAEPPAGLPAHWGTFENTQNFLDYWQKLDLADKREIIVKYYALCSMLDAQFGRIAEWLCQRNLMENTWIVFASDHGESLGDRGRFSKYSLYDSSVRVPLAIAGPGITEEMRGKEMDGPVELIDLLPTILGLAGLPVPEWLPGYDLLGEVPRDGSFAEMHGSGAEQHQTAPIYMWRSRDWKLILRLPGTLWEAHNQSVQWQGELYDLAEDPLELNNLYDDPAQQKRRENMTLCLLRRLACTAAMYPHPDTRPRLRPKTGV